MRFAVDAHAIGCRLTGNEVYVRNLLNAFATLTDDLEFIAYVSGAQFGPWIPARFETRHVARNPFLRLGWDLPRRLHKDCPNLLHVQYTAPLNCPVPVVVTVHDVSFLEHPEYFTWARSTQLRWTVRHTIRNAARILTGSEFSRRAIADAYGIDSDNIVVVPNAAEPLFRPIPRESAAQRVRARFHIPGPFLLTVGDLQPRKNHIGLIRAFAGLLRELPLPHRLVIAGQQTWYASRVRKAAEQSGFADRIHFTGFVSDRDLLDLYNACDLFVFPSLYEGFGLPVLEAMACGRAVACSNTSAIPEVADAAAILFDPSSVGDMIRAMADLLRDPELRVRMERLGLQRAAHFSWQQTACKTLDAYLEVAGLQSRRPAKRPVSVGRS